MSYFIYRLKQTGTRSEGPVYRGVSDVAEMKWEMVGDAVELAETMVGDAKYLT